VMGTGQRHWIDDHIGQRLGIVNVVLSFTAVLLVLLSLDGWAGEKQRMNLTQRDAVEEFVKTARGELEASYYDPGFHGVDLKARSKEAIDRIDKTESLSDAFGIIAWMLEPLNDSHTFFLPPPRPYLVDNGWEAEMIGEKCYIVAVRLGSDAAAQGIQPGDELVSLEGYTVTRDNLWKLRYAFEGLAPRSSTHVSLHSPQGLTRTLVVNAKVEKVEKVIDPFGSPEYFREKRIGHVTEPRVVVRGDDLVIWKLPRFGSDTDEIDKSVRQAHKYPKLILDLRGNPGGAETAISRLIGSMFDKEIRVGERVTRHERKPWTVKSRGGENVYSGKLVVLVDSESGSAAEIFARVVQIEKRGTVIGDRTAGKVREGRQKFFCSGRFEPFCAGFSVTVADLLLTDGKSLEDVGVLPDVVVLPTPMDLSAGRDPVLQRAAAELGASMTTEEAGKLFPHLWLMN
jgi:C-terminal processing protease CtpA/Prc